MARSFLRALAACPPPPAAVVAAGVIVSLPPHAAISRPSAPVAPAPPTMRRKRLRDVGSSWRRASAPDSVSVSDTAQPPREESMVRGTRCARPLWHCSPRGPGTGVTARTAPDRITAATEHRIPTHGSAAPEGRRASFASYRNGRRAHDAIAPDPHPPRPDPEPARGLGGVFCPRGSRSGARGLGGRVALGRPRGGGAALVPVAPGAARLRALAGRAARAPRPGPDARHGHAAHGADRRARDPRDLLAVRVGARGARADRMGRRGPGARARRLRARAAALADRHLQLPALRARGGALRPEPVRRPPAQRAPGRGVPLLELAPPAEPVRPVLHAHRLRARAAAAPHGVLGVEGGGRARLARVPRARVVAGGPPRPVAPALPRVRGPQPARPRLWARRPAQRRAHVAVRAGRGRAGRARPRARLPALGRGRRRGDRRRRRVQVLAARPRPAR